MTSAASCWVVGGSGAALRVARFLGGAGSSSLLEGALGLARFLVLGGSSSLSESGGALTTRFFFSGAATGTSTIKGFGLLLSDPGGLPRFFAGTAGGSS